LNIKFLTDISAIKNYIHKEKLKEYDYFCLLSVKINKTRINIGHQHDRWMELKEALRVQTHAELPLRMLFGKLLLSTVCKNIYSLVKRFFFSFTNYNKVQRYNSVENFQCIKIKTLYTDSSQKYLHNSNFPYIYHNTTIFQKIILKSIHIVQRYNSVDFGDYFERFF
jgi:hypothetical protein